MMRRGAVLCCTVLMGCNVTSGGDLISTAPDSKVGNTYWVNSYAAADLCPAPTTGFRPPSCQQIPKGEKFTVVDAGNSGYPSFQRFYKVKLSTGAEGFVRPGVIDSALDEAGHTRQAELQAERQKKIATEKADCDRKGSVHLGMTRDQVYASCFGKPDRINTTATSRGKDEQFVYSSGTYIYLTNGIVRSWQQTTR